jgi:hypothetical protein
MTFVKWARSIAEKIRNRWGWLTNPYHGLIGDGGDCEITTEGLKRASRHANYMANVHGRKVK